MLCRPIYRKRQTTIKAKPKQITHQIEIKLIEIVMWKGATIAFYATLNSGFFFSWWTKRRSYRVTICCWLEHQYEYKITQNSGGFFFVVTGKRRIILAALLWSSGNDTSLFCMLSLRQILNFENEQWALDWLLYVFMRAIATGRSPPHQNQSIDLEHLVLFLFLVSSTQSLAYHWNFSIELKAIVWWNGTPQHFSARNVSYFMRVKGWVWAPTKGPTVTKCSAMRENASFYTHKRE